VDVDDDLPISALSHFVYCRRRAALVHVLGLWAENVYTTSGKIVHERIDEGEATARPCLRILRSVRVRSERLRLSGVIDVVEVHEADEETWFLPVETKRGRRRRWQRDDVQLCAQAMALEEMVGARIAKGAIFHAASKRRRVVKLDAALRTATEETARELHALFAQRLVPQPVRDERCPQCSLAGDCQPDDIGLPRTLRDAIQRSLR
jgi:CRISPR-associated exonuclease Cas4